MKIYQLHRLCNLIKNYLKLFPVIISCFYCVSISSNHRKAAIESRSSGTVLSMSNSEYGEFLSKNKVITNTPEAQMVQQVGQNIQHSVERFFAQNNLSERLKGYHWEFNLVEGKSVNAWCMPGGKVVVYTGILPVAKDDVGLAVVVGHEIAHAVAQHGDERMSQGLLAQMGGVALATALSSKPKETNQLFMAAYGIGTQVGVLMPYSRLQESEADRLGLIFMAMAGYDPRAAVDFWKRMAAKKREHLFRNS